MKSLRVILILIFSQPSFGQIKVTSIDKTQFPSKLQYNGKIIHSARWTDATGDNIVLLTKTAITKSKNPLNEGSDGSLYAYHYLITGDTIRLTWKVYDFVKDCDVDMFLNYLDNTFAVTDLNKDGKAEVWLMYKVSCQGDVSPVPMTLIMYQDNQKYAVRGTTRVQVSANEFMGGEFAFDESFKNGPEEFRKYAEKRWIEHRKETWTQR